MSMVHLELQYERVDSCPLCGGRSVERAQLERSSYYFGHFRVPLPPEGVWLRECADCALLFKSRIPSRDGLAKLLSSSGHDVWRPKKGVHPALGMIEPYLGTASQDFLDVGASNGDLLAQLQPHAGRLSALDVQTYPLCQGIVTGEYIVGQIDEPIAWSGSGYDVVTAFDVFEHFVDVRRAVENIAALVKSKGHLIVETGDWTFVSGRLGRWYYCNLIEHQVFWSRRTFQHVCARFGFELVQYDRVNHKGRRAHGSMKRLALGAFTGLVPLPGFCAAMIAVTGRDPSLFGEPLLKDHTFAVLQRMHPV